MEDTKHNTQYCDSEKEEFDDALDDFPFYDCQESFIERIKSGDGISISESCTSLPETKASTPTNLRCKRSLSHHRSPSENTTDMSKPSSLVSSETCLNSGKRELNLHHTIKKNKLDSGKSASLELELIMKSVKDVIEESNEKEEDTFTLTDARFSNKEEDLVSDESSYLPKDSNSNSTTKFGNRSNLGENEVVDSSYLFRLANLMVKGITFQVNMFVKLCLFPIWSSYYIFMLIFNPVGLLKCGKRCIFHHMKRVWSFVCANVSPFVYDWLKEHKAIWKLGLKCGWGLLWSCYVGIVLVGLLVSAFIFGGLLIRRVVDEPLTMKSNLNFDYTEKSPVAYVPIIAYPAITPDIYFVNKPKIGKDNRLRIIPHNHKVQVTVSLTLPESDYNQNLGIFQVKVDFLANDGSTIASSRRPCMLHYKSQPIRILLTFLKIAPILTGYTTETQNLRINFKGLKEGVVPTTSLRVVIEQRAEFLPGKGIPEIYSSSLVLESELPMFRKMFWFWRKTLFVWISMAIFLIELVLVLLCCKPCIIPRLRLRQATNGSIPQNDLPSRR